MKKKISLRLWLAVLFRGLWQALCWVGRGLNPKYKTPFWRVVWAAIAVCVVIVTAMLCHQYYLYHTRDTYRYSNGKYISPFYTYIKPYDKAGIIKNVRTEEIVARDIDWLVVSDDADSLAVFCRKGKRGYINRYTGRVAIPEQYDAAWVFSSGMAAVAVGVSVHFIDHSGRPVNGRKHYYHRGTQGYAYHGDYCAMTDSIGNVGLIDRNGDWAVEPTCKYATAQFNNYWIISRDSLRYAYNDRAEQVTDGYASIIMTSDAGIVCTRPDHSQVSFNFDGSPRCDFLCHTVEQLYYTSDELDEEGDYIQKPARCCHYIVSNGHEGLMDASGHPITKPLYWTISAISENTYLCTYKDTNAGVVINGNGEIIGDATN